MIKKTVSAAVLVAVLCGAAALYGAPRDTCTAAMKDSCHQKMFEQLNLTADQKAKMKVLREEMKTLRMANMEKMKALRDNSKGELLKAAPSKTVLYGFAKEMGDLHKAMSEQMADHMLKVKSVLSKEQFEKMLSRDFLKGMRDGKTGVCPKTGKPCKMGGPGGMHGMED